MGINVAAEYFESDEPERWRKLGVQNYHISAWAYFNRSYNLFSLTLTDYSYLFYCALELRCAIERIFSEYLYHLRDSPLSKGQQKLWSARDLKSAILKLEPDFLLKIELLNFFIEARGEGEKFEIPDLDRLSNDYGRLGNYLHARRGDEMIHRHPNWWDELRRLIEDLHDYAWPYCSAAKPRIELDMRAGELLNGLKAGEIDGAQIVAILKSGKVDPNFIVTWKRFFD